MLKENTENVIKSCSTIIDELVEGRHVDTAILADSLALKEDELISRLDRLGELPFRECLNIFSAVSKQVRPSFSLDRRLPQEMTPGFGVQQQGRSSIAEEPNTYDVGPPKDLVGNGLICLMDFLCDNAANLIAGEIIDKKELIVYLETWRDTLKQKAKSG